MSRGGSAMFEVLNRRLARWISARPRLFLVSSVAAALFLSSAILNCTVEQDIRRSFSPPNSRGSKEEEIYESYYNLTGEATRLFISVYAKDGGSMLRSAHMQEMLRVHEQVQEVINRTDRSGRSLCFPMCHANTPLIFFWREFENELSGGKLSGDRNSTVFDFPMSKILDRDVFVGLNMVDVRRSERVAPSNRSRLTYVGSIALWYSWQTSDTLLSGAVYKRMAEMLASSIARNFSRIVDYTIYDDETANSEMMRGAYVATKLMLGGFVLLVVFVFAVVKSKVRNVKSLSRIAVATVLSPFLAAAMSFGLLSWLRFSIYSIMCVTPFLILGIGVDDAFIMLGSWTHLRKITDKRQRLEEVFVAIGPSISITSITNTVAFGIGFFTPAPQMSMFCLCTSLACLIDYILTFTLFAPILLMSGDDKVETTAGDEQPSIDQSTDSHTSTKHQKFERCLRAYSGFLCSWKGRTLVVLTLVCLYAVSAFGVLRMQTNFEPSKAFPANSPLTYTLASIKAVFTEYFPMKILINNAPNISDPVEYANFYAMISSLEAQPLCHGRNLTMMFLTEYEKYDRGSFDFFHSLGILEGVQYSPSYDSLAAFIDHVKEYVYVKTRTDQKGALHLAGFPMTLMARNMSRWANRAFFVESSRALLDLFPQFNATVFDGDYAILDLILTVKSDMLGSIAVTVICMAIVCIFFIPTRTGLLIITFTISSICFTLVGGLAWWGADLDPVTMVDVLIATGFSVDYTAHIAYKYYDSNGDERQRVEQSLREMCAPMMQAGTSTVLCMLPLIFVPTYAILALAMTVFLVVGLGLLHGLFVLPVLLTTISFSLPSSRPSTPQKCPPSESDTKEPLVL